MIWLYYYHTVIIIICLSGPDDWVSPFEFPSLQSTIQSPFSRMVVAFGYSVLNQGSTMKSILRICLLIFFNASQSQRICLVVRSCIPQNLQSCLMFMVFTSACLIKHITVWHIIYSECKLYKIIARKCSRITERYRLEISWSFFTNNCCIKLNSN